MALDELLPKQLVVLAHVIPQFWGDAVLTLVGLASHNSIKNVIFLHKAIEHKLDRGELVITADREGEFKVCFS
jgi:hypothetical protein